MLPWVLGDLPLAPDVDNKLFSLSLFSKMDRRLRTPDEDRVAEDMARVSIMSAHTYKVPIDVHELELAQCPSDQSTSRLSRQT